jgi:predicted HTH transcriptional regulator
VAFANADGGSVYLGVRDDGKVLGVQLANESETAWVNEIKSKTAPGGLSGGLTVADLLADRYATKARNPEIAELFRCAGLTERYGSGIKRIMMACKTHGYVDVEFQNLESWFRVILRKTGDGDFTKPLEKADVGKALQKSSLKSSLKILEILAEEPTCTYDELAEKLGASRRAITNSPRRPRQGRTLGGRGHGE